MEANSRPGVAGRSVDAGQGMSWWSDAWTLFMKSAGLWFVFGLVVCIGSAILHLIPVLGSLVSALLLPVLLGGWMLAARKVEDGGALEFNDLFAGFKGPLLSSLLVLGVATLVCELIVGVLVTIMGVGSVTSLVLAGHTGAGLLGALGFGMLALLFVLVFVFVLAMLLWFAPALIVFDGVPPMDAMKLSAETSLRNIGPFVIFGVISIVLSILSVLLMGLGFLVLVPLEVLAMYTSYRNVFSHPTIAAPQA
jgi:uncharacterized membrane protein